LGGARPIASTVRAERYRATPGAHRTQIKNRIHATSMTFGHPCSVSDLDARIAGGERDLRRGSPRTHVSSLQSVPGIR